MHSGSLIMFGRIARHLGGRLAAVAQIRHKSGPVEPYVQKKFVPRRACLYVPGSDLAKIEKVKKLDVDSLILDCEDGVAATAKVSRTLPPS